VKSWTRHQTETSVHLTWEDLRSAIQTAALAAMSEAGERCVFPGGIKIDIMIRQETEGSPPYNVPRWFAHVAVVGEHLPDGPEESET